ncbi:aldehyde dehydrogenase [Pluteus cervinus]|uniref:Aldehyde dehydrogenase n=1 Tax=Pluteus cervinus TaxID=181527 RepID=A0ACD3B2F1_9AGAR|nr:aldehyde dehydrogenase [Pluteus cervinus]
MYCGRRPAVTNAHIISGLMYTARRLHTGPKKYRPHSTVLSAHLPDKEEIPVHNPASGECIALIESSSEGLVHHTIENAQSVFDSGSWSRAPPSHRANVLNRLAGILKDNIPELARLESLQTGRAIREMNAQLGRLPEWLEYYAALLRTHQGYVAPAQGKLLNYVQRIPLGVVAQITPFNHPLLIALKKIAPALAAGNSVVVKPSELAPITVLELADMALNAGVPPGVLSILPGMGTSTGRAIVSHPRIKKVDVTAGTQTGRALGSIVGANLASFTAELGGKAPILIFNDADLISAVNGAAFASFVASGQTCVSGTRIIVQAEIYDKFLTQFMKKVQHIRDGMGNPSNPACTMGTVISPKHLQRIQDMVNRSHGKILTGGQRMSGKSELDGFDFSNGSFYPPTVITDVDLKEEIWEEEVFGPVVIIKRFVDDLEGVELANACRYGLGAGIWTSDLSRAHRISSAIEAGLCWVNTHHRNDPSSPWGGMKESGLGRENGLEAFESYTQSKSTIVNIATPEEMRENEDWFADSAGPQRYG